MTRTFCTGSWDAQANTIDYVQVENTRMNEGSYEPADDGDRVHKALATANYSLAQDIQSCKSEPKLSTSITETDEVGIGREQRHQVHSESEAHN